MAQASGFPVNQVGQTEPPMPDQQTGQDIPANYELVGENELFQLHVDRTTLAFKVVDKRSGYVWNSNLDTVTPEDQLNKTWTAFATSGISLDYLDQKAASKRVSLTNSNHTVDVQSINQGFQATVTFSDYSISVGVIVTLEANGVSVEVPNSSIKEDDPAYKLGVLYAYPFLGATKEDSISGYMFIPDGSGSLIRFSKSTKAQNMFYGKYYGPDFGMITNLPFDRTINRPNNLSIPVFGMVHEEKQNAFISIVESGASYGELQVHPAGVITKFNFLYSAFVYNESYFQATNRSGDGVTTIQRKTNVFDVKIHYRFLTKQDADYVGMARSYQQYLKDMGILNKVFDLNTNIGIKLEFLGGEKERILFWDRSIPMTTVSQMSDILQDLKIKNPDVVYYGWQPLGASTTPPTTMKLEGSLGTLDQLSALAQKITSDGGNFYLYLDPQAALTDEGGYSPRNDLAMSITNSDLVGFNRNKINYYLNFAALSRDLSSLSMDVVNKIKAGLALDGIGLTLYSDFKNNHFMNREETIRLYQKLITDDVGSTAFYTPNDYMFGNMKAYYDMPLTDNGYIYTSDVVPFLQIVFAGYIPFYGPALNFTSDVQEDLLRQIDFDVYPSYFLSNARTANILNTSSNWIYTSSYGQWEKEIKRSYLWMNNLLAPVKGQEIIARQTLAPGVVATTYSNGRQIIVNYSDQPFTAGNLVVNSRDAAIR
ncbi:MAG TPA: DUF5696 domain-containing protein [Longilinea sp.]|nr:DUF5696 domain-containing protein [Longilinea sp.]